MIPHRRSALSSGWAEAAGRAVRPLPAPLLLLVLAGTAIAAAAADHLDGPHNRCPAGALCEMCPHPSGLLKDSGEPVYIFTWNEEDPASTPPACECDEYQCLVDEDGNIVTVRGDPEDHCVHPCPSSWEEEEAQTQTETVSIGPQPAIQLVTSTIQDPPPEPLPEPRPMPVSEAQVVRDVYLKCPCPDPNPNGLVYLAKNCDADEPRDDDCLLDPSRPEPKPLPVRNNEADPDADTITVTGGNFGGTSKVEVGDDPQQADPGTGAVAIPYEPVPLVRCPCPDNDLRVRIGQEEVYYVTHVDLENGETCPDEVSFDLCPEVIVSMVSPNPPMLCPCPNNPNEWFQGYEGLKLCEDGPGDDECKGSNLPAEPPEEPVVAHLEEVDCQCPFHDDEGEVVWYEIDPEHLLKGENGEEVCPDMPPEGEGEECPPDPRYLGPPEVLDEGENGGAEKGPPPVKGPEGGPPGRSGGPSPGRAKKRASRTHAHEVSHVAQQDPGKAKKAAANDDGTADTVGMVDEKSAAAAAAAQHHRGPCSGETSKMAYAVCDKYCVQDKCPELPGRTRRRRLTVRRQQQRRQQLGPTGPSSRTLKTPQETCMQLERRYTEITKRGLDCGFE